MLLTHAIFPLLGDPQARWYSSLSPSGQNLWNGTVVGVAAILLLLAIAGGIEKLYWWLRKRNDA